MRLLVALSAIVALAAVAPEAQPPQNPTFRSGADVVRIDVSVLDKNRVPVQGLTAAATGGHIQPWVSPGTVPVGVPELSSMWAYSKEGAPKSALLYSNPRDPRPVNGISGICVLLAVSAI